MNLSANELQYRFLLEDGSKLFNKDVPTVNLADDNEQPNCPGLPAGLSPLADFGERYKAFRMFLQDLALPRMKETFRLRAGAFNTDYPNCKTLDDFLLEYRTGPYDNKKREMVDVLCNKMWGRECVGTIEKIVMDKVKLRYKNALVDPHMKVKTRRSHGSIKKMINRMKQTLFIDRFR